jgi:citrate/tricarballylate utilization protein
VALAAGALASALAARTFEARGTADFYSVIPHDVMVTVLGIAGLFAVIALSIGYRRFTRGIANQSIADLKGPRSMREGVADLEDPRRRGIAAATRDALTLKHLHATGQDCVDAEETRRPWRRWMHHCTFYGFLLCFASTSVAAIYHLVFGWIAPYAYTSIPVVLGTSGGLGLLIGPAGLFLVDRFRDPALSHRTEGALHGPFLALLFLTSATGLLLLVLRASAYMPLLLMLHLAVVLALFVTLPYGKFVHGIYRAAALVKFRREIDH